MRHSIKFKFFAASCAIAVAFVGILSLLNVIFYDDYYLWQRQRGLREIHQEISTLYAADADLLTSAILHAEDTEGVRLSVMGADGLLYYDSGLRERTFVPDSELHHGLSIVEGALKTVDLNDVHGSNVAFARVSDPKRGDEFLCLVGELAGANAYLIARIPFTYMQQSSVFNMVFLLISGGVTLLVCIFLAFFIARHFTRPLIAIGDVANAMASLDFSKKYEGSAKDEIGALGLSINCLSAHLEQTIAALRTRGEQLAREIDEKERIDAMRREFIINVSHELKTPIALIQGYAEGLREGIADAPADRDFYCTTIMEEAARMNNLVMQLLNLSKLELGREVPQPTTVHLDDLLTAAIQKTALLAEGRDLNIHFQPSHLTVQTDENLLDQVIQNYLTNAIRYTRRGGNITLSATRTPSGTRLSVINEGDPVPADELPRLWDKFYRTDRARSRESGGTGIGLSIVRATAETLNADYGCANINDGMEFWFTLRDA